MFLILGKNELVEKYAEENLEVDMESDIVYYPDTKCHYTELKKYVDIAKEEEPPVITTQSLEMIEELLNSDLDFHVITVVEINGNINARKVTKEKAKKLKYDYGLELR